MPSHLTPLPSPKCFPLCRSLPASVGCQGGWSLWTLLQEGAVVACALEGGSTVSEGPVAIATLASLRELCGGGVVGEPQGVGEATDGGRGGRVIRSGAVCPRWHLSAWMGGEDEVPLCPALSHGHPPGSRPELSRRCPLLPPSRNL